VKLEHVGYLEVVRLACAPCLLYNPARLGIAELVIGYVFINRTIFGVKKCH